MLCLTSATDPQWVDHALSDLNAVLVDHAHCEMKAASNALSLAVRAADHPNVVRKLTLLAEEELRHFQRVLVELDRRGVALGKPPIDEYAAELRKLSNASTQSRKRLPSDWLVDRLLVGAIIEARSCERFKLLANALEKAQQHELAAFYEELFSSEARHFRELFDLAVEVAKDEAAVRARLVALSEAEGSLARELGVRASIHG